MRLIDDEGRVFGRVNVVDAAVVVFLVAAAIAAAAAVSNGGLGWDQRSENVTVTIASSNQPYLTDAIREDDGCGGGPRVENVTVVESGFNETRGLVMQRIRTTATIQATPEGEGWEYGDTALYIGNTIEFDLCRTRVDGTVVDIREGDDAE